MNEDLLIPYYTKIANQLNCIIPGEWHTVALYGEELGDNRMAKLFFKTEENGEYISGGRIPEIYGVNQNIYFQLIIELCGQIKELRDEFVRQDMQEWKAITFILDKNFKFKIEYSYDIEMEVGSYERSIFWAYEKLGIVPKDDFEKQILNKYLSKKSFS